MALERLTYSDFVGEVAKRTEVDEKTVKKVLTGFREEVIDCAANGYAVTIPSFIKFTLKFEPAKRKGEMIRSPQSGEMQPRKEGKPAGFKLKAAALPTASV